MSDLSGVNDISGISIQWNPPPPNPYIVTLSELLSAHNVVVQKEAEDRANASRFVSPNGDDLRPKLFEWANKGFPTIYPIRTLEITAPLTCSDGEARVTLQYLEYLIEKTIPQCLSTLQEKMPGIEVTFSHSANTVTLHVSRAV